MLTIEKQIEVIDLVIVELQKEVNRHRGLGLCYFMKCSLGVIGRTLPTELHIPLFTRENAIKFANAQLRGIFWWSNVFYDYNNRLYFLGWIKNELINSLTD